MQHSVSYGSLKKNNQDTMKMFRNYEVWQKLKGPIILSKSKKFLT